MSLVVAVTDTLPSFGHFSERNETFGYEHYFFKSFEEVTGINISYIHTNELHCDTEGSNTNDVCQYVRRGISDIGAGVDLGVLLDEFEYSQPYRFDDITVLTNPIHRKEYSIHPLMAFQIKVWLTLFFAYIISAHLLKLSYFMRKRKDGQPWWTLICTFLAQQQPLKLNPEIRVFYYFWFFGILLILSYYKNYVTSKLSTFEPEIRLASIGDVIKAARTKRIELMIMISPKCKREKPMRLGCDEISNLVNVSFICSEDEPCFRQLLKRYTTSVIVGPRETLEALIAMYGYKNIIKLPETHQFDGSLEYVKKRYSIIFKPKSRMKIIFDKFILRCTQAGLFEAWTESTLRRVENKLSKTLRGTELLKTEEWIDKKESLQTLPVTIKSMSKTLRVCFVMYIISCIVFVVELLIRETNCFQLQQRRRPSRFIAINV